MSPLCKGENVELVLRVGFNSFFPKLDLLSVVLLQVVAKRRIKLLDILELLSVLNRLRETSQFLHWLFDSLNETMGPGQSACNWRHVGRDWSVGFSLFSVNKHLTFHEDGGNCLQVLLVQFQKSDVLLLKLILNVWSVEESFEGIEQLELSDDGVAIVETLSQDGSKSALELLDPLAELVEIILELSPLDVHDVVLDFHEVRNSFLELVKDLEDSGAESLTLGVANINLLQFRELDD